jgi:hypothetical protein
LSTGFGEFAGLPVVVPINNPDREPFSIFDPTLTPSGRIQRNNALPAM